MDQIPVTTDVPTGGLPAGQAEAMPAPVSTAETGVNNSAVATPGDALGSVDAPSQSVNQPAENSFELPDDDDDLKPIAHTRQGQNFKQLRQHARQLKNELAQIRESAQRYEPLNAVLENYGDAATVAQRLQMFDQLNEYQRDENGQVVFENGLPMRSASGFVNALAQESMPAVERLYSAIWQMPINDDGATYGQYQLAQMLERQGISPEAFSAFVSSVRETGTYQPPNAQPEKRTLASQNTPPTDEELGYVDEKYHKAFASLSPKERERLLTELEPDDAIRRLEDAQAVLEAKELSAQFKAQQEQQAQRQQQEQEQYQQAFQGRVMENLQASNASLNQNIASQVMSKLAQDFNLGADDPTNQVLLGLPTATVFGLLVPELRPLIEPMMKASGLEIEADTFPLLEELETVTAEMVWRKEVAADARMRNQHDGFALKQAEQRYDQLVKRLTARAQRYSQTLAQPMIQRLVGSAQSQNSRIDQAQQTRPTVTGQPTANVSSAPAKNWLELSMRSNGLR